MSAQQAASFLSLLQEWQTDQEKGPALLSSLQACLHALDTETNEPPEIYLKILKQAPSARLEAFIHEGKQLKPASPSLMDTVSANLVGLRELQSASDGCVRRMASLAAEAEQDVLSADGRATSTAGLSDQEKRKFCQADLAVAMLEVVASLEKHTIMTEKIISAVELDTPLAQLASYSIMWDLQPYVDDDAVAALRGWLGYIEL